MSDALNLSRNYKGESSEADMLDCCQEAFHSFAEENEGNWDFETASFESCSYEKDSELSSVSEASNCKDNRVPSATIQDDQAEVPDPEIVQKELFCKWIAILQDKDYGARGRRKAQETPAGATEEAGDVLDALQTFCSMKINQISHPLNPHQRKGIHQKILHIGVPSNKPMAGELKGAVPAQLMSRVQLKNIQETMKQLAGIKMHQPSKCADCCRKKGELAKIEFLKQRKTAMQTALLQEKIDETIFLKDSITLIGEIHQTLPKLSEDPEIIWQRLLESAAKM
uniref:Uncharacterized protein C8orf48 homolog n=1 Tax=Geotrypetes seraphini TaxID=260995 RepID=A0A6P8RJ91_GEOSA|nr:uncharacterized protein C8orf48 homolog [Geotrypetes seraphini]XP_033803125.1 uncharacterized protein C8orf48 homolog [Geotrypetes seraphini]XP_033803126.1 uncharacterized protein C8orf48 homolog [Geotrypetes seraphini]XP_033803127.1 uncharacterized protein C8orf48 homolog [Geotrypetes seraphini]XP_033803128.1 uncharacterized protein C8orf48 homolog [Geotrypetes seraphini]XP_033803129.1 uncharacterized protein C8orf48 homolog [Geotrypetes seraphini]XP_033803130.1 uncharacterized protein C8